MTTIPLQQQRPTNVKTKSFESWTRRLLLALFQYGRFLDVFNCLLDKQKLQVLPISRNWKFGMLAIRIIIILIYWDVIPHMVKTMFLTPNSFDDLYRSLQITSVAVFSTAMLFMKARDDWELINMINRFLELYKRIENLTNTPFIFCKSFFICIVLNTCFTILGYLNEMPALLMVESLTFNKWLGVVIGIFLWLGCMYLMDACFLGFLVLSLMYNAIGGHLRAMLNNMRNIEPGLESDGIASLSSYKRMKLLCDYSDKLDHISGIYCDLYKLTKHFVQIFQWHILYCIYYTFMVIFLALNYIIFQYLHTNYIEFEEIFWVLLKICNVSLMIICANYAVDKSELPNHLSLDVICSDIDIRWDCSVETFINQRKVENLEVKILGFLTINNQLILLILSAIISYLFMIIQFGMTGGMGNI